MKVVDTQNNFSYSKFMTNVTLLNLRIAWLCVNQPRSLKVVKTSNQLHKLIKERMLGNLIKQKIQLLKVTFVHDSNFSIIFRRRFPIKLSFLSILTSFHWGKLFLKKKRKVSCVKRKTEI